MKKLIDSLKTRKLLAQALERDARSMHGRIVLTCEPEDVQIEGNASAIGPDEDRETNAWIYSQLRSGNEWAWCHVTVTVQFGDYSSSDSLGCCSYESAEAFKAPGGYYDDMIRVCCVDLVAQLFAARETLDRLWSLATRSVTEEPATDSE